MRAAVYARYSSSNQRDASIEDQLRLCREFAARQGWPIICSYTDRAISGASLLRPGIQELIADAGKRRFDVILTESLDRLSRDQEDIAGLYKRMRFAGIRIVTLAEGDVSELHVGLKGTMGALYLKDLADKTRRGLRGRIDAGKSAGGVCYGYNVVRQFAANGEPLRGDRAINEAEAAVVRRIFHDYVAGRSSRAIAWQLNRDKVPGPYGKEWGPSTIHGNRARGTGVLNNELYAGRLVWNRLRYLKDPDTGKRVSRLNPESDWVVQDVADLRIVDQALWDAAKQRQQAMTLGPAQPDTNPLLERRRPKHLFAGLVKCGCCGGGYAMISKDLLGCSTARTKGTCGNRLNIRRDALEASILGGLRTHLMDPALFQEFCAEFTKEVNRLRMAAGASIAAARSELDKIERQIAATVDAIADGMYHRSMKDKVTGLEARKAELVARLAAVKAPPPLLHPNLAGFYRERISALHESLQDAAGRTEAAEIVRGLVDRVTLVPEDGQLVIVLRGDLAALLALAANKQKPVGLSADGLGLLSQGSLVAGTGFEPVTFRL